MHWALVQPPTTPLVPPPGQFPPLAVRSGAAVRGAVLGGLKREGWQGWKKEQEGRRERWKTKKAKARVRVREGLAKAEILRFRISNCPRTRNLGTDCGTTSA